MSERVEERDAVNEAGMAAAPTKDFEKRWRGGDRLHTLRPLLQSWRGLAIAAASIVLVGFGLSYAATPNETCLTTEGVVQGLRISQSPRGDFPKRVVTLAMYDNRIVDVAAPMSDLPEKGNAPVGRALYEDGLGSREGHASIQGHYQLSPVER